MSGNGSSSSGMREADARPRVPPDLDNLSEDELDALLQQLESGTDAHD